MKNTDDLMGFLEPNQFGNIPIENTQLSDEEVNRIHALTMANINGKAKPIKKRMSKKAVISLIAAIIVVSSFTVFAASGGLGYLFNKQLNAKTDNEIEYLKKSTKETIAFSGGVDYSIEAKAVLTDKNTAKIYFDLIENGDKSVEMVDKFKEVRVYYQNDDGSLEEIPSGRNITKQEDTNPDDNRVGFILDIQNGNAIKSGKIAIDLGELKDCRTENLFPYSVNLQDALNEAKRQINMN